MCYFERLQGQFAGQEEEGPRVGDVVTEVNRITRRIVLSEPQSLASMQLQAYATLAEPAMVDSPRGGRLRLGMLPLLWGSARDTTSEAGFPRVIA